MRIQQFAAVVIFTLVVIALSAVHASAHHSVAGYDTGKEITLKGTVKEFVWRNPHVFVVWAVKESNGTITEWAAEMNSPTSMIQVGMNRNSLKPGDEIVALVNPSKTGNPLGIIRKINLADGTLIVDRFTPK